jgi:hypothetical protein
LKKCTYEDYIYQREDNVAPSNISIGTLLVMTQEMPTSSIVVATTNTRGRTTSSIVVPLLI